MQLLFTGHMDTVFAADHPFQDVFWREEGVLGGPGVADMKSGIAVMLAALRAVEAAGVPGLGYEVVINSDEEVGSPGSAALIAEAARGKKAALTYEPSALARRHARRRAAGQRQFLDRDRGPQRPCRAQSRGRPQRDARRRRSGAAAGRGEAGRAQRQSGQDRRRRARTMSCPTTRCCASTCARRRRSCRRSPSACSTRRSREIAAAHDVAIHVHGGFARPPKPIDAEARKLFELVRRSGADLGQDIGWRDSGGVCDGNNIAACGVPVVDTMGARGGAIHSDQEYLIVDSLAERAQLSALTIIRLANGEAL